MGPVYHGEEAVLLKYFGPVNTGSVIVDVGAYHPTWKSNSYYFEKQGWTAICIEANKYCIPGLKAQRSRVYHYGVANEIRDDGIFHACRVGHGPDGMAGYSALYVSPERREDLDPKVIEEVPVLIRPLDWILEHDCPDIDHIDILCIDTEMGELDVLRGTDLDRWKPKVVFAENLDEYDNDLSVLRTYMAERGYDFQEYVSHQNDLYLRRG